MNFKRLAITLLLLASLVLLGACNSQPKQESDQSAPATPSVTLDRQGLVDLMVKYLNALAKHDTAAVPFAEKVKYTENTAEIPIGKGLWTTASAGPSEFQIYAADPVAQQVACLVMMKELDKDVLLGARLKVENGKITEAEHLAIRDLGTSPFGAAAMANLKTPRPGLLEDVPEAERMSRDDLIKIGLTYYDALTGEDGKLSPFAEECERHENGATTAGGKPQTQTGIPAPMNPEFAAMMKAMEEVGAVPNTCEAQISTGQFSYISDIQNRRVLIGDVQKGLAVGFSMFYHDSSLKEYKYKGSKGEKMLPAYQGLFNLPAMHIYKIKNGKIYDIEAIGFTMPYGLKSGWE
ncbi:MAG: hypothetical protein QUT30_08865 [Acidobacteriota bacterium]|nr:hypothetical protein [Acidobacteriota bacterium]